MDDIKELVNQYVKVTSEYSRLGGVRARVKNQIGKYMNEYASQTGEDSVWVDGNRIKVKWKIHADNEMLDGLHDILSSEMVERIYLSSSQRRRWKVGVIHYLTFISEEITDERAVKLIKKALSYSVGDINILSNVEQLMNESNKLRKRANKLENRARNKLKARVSSREQFDKWYDMNYTTDNTLGGSVENES